MQLIPNVITRLIADEWVSDMDVNEWIRTSRATLARLKEYRFKRNVSYRLTMEHQNRIDHPCRYGVVQYMEYLTDDPLDSALVNSLPATLVRLQAYSIVRFDRDTKLPSRL